MIYEEKVTRYWLILSRVFLNSGDADASVHRIPTLIYDY